MKIIPWSWKWILVLGLSSVALISPASAGQLTWQPGVFPPRLDLKLGDGSVKRSLILPSGTDRLEIHLDRFLMESDAIDLEWTSGGQIWMRQRERLTSSPLANRYILPPGKSMSLTLKDSKGRTLAELSFRRN